METEKLELKKLCGYLPYGLQVRYFDAERGEEKICRIELVHIPDELTISDGMDEYDVDFDDIKPLVIPLSALTKEDWIEVFKAGSDGLRLDRIERLPSIVIGFTGQFQKVYYARDIYEFHVENSGLDFNQLASFNKLYSLHADLHGWLDRGLALNKLDFNSK